MLTKLVQWWINLDWSWLVQPAPDEQQPQVYEVFLNVRGEWYVYRFTELTRWQAARYACFDARLTLDECDRLAKMIRDCGREEIRVTV
jgi:hypothetical protein